MQPITPSTTKALLGILAASAAVLLVACGRPSVSDVAEAAGSVRVDLSAVRGHTISGVVHDIRGETLPGVAVTCLESGDQVITGPLGTYRVRFQPGEVTLNFIKSGYTPGILELESGGASSLEADPVRLYRLPIDSGVYFFENLNYRPVDSILPERFVVVKPELGAVFGTRRREVSITEDPMPTLIGFRIPRSGASLYRMRSLDMRVMGPREQEVPVEGWVPAHAVAVSMAPIDEPDGLLRVMQLEEPLAPGRYALHWGALDGDRDLDQRVFFFDVVEPVEAEEEEEGGEVEAGGDEAA